MNTEHFKQKYGPWALIAGGSTGIGEAFARLLAQHGINLVLVARRQPLLEKLSQELEKDLNIAVRTVSVDLAEETAITKIVEKTTDLEVNMLVYNAAVELMGPFFSHDVKTHLHAIDVNSRGLIILIDHFGRLMQQRKRGGIILISSMACLSGGPLIAHYSASKAYINNLAEGLWYELKPDNIDVISCIAGNTNTPNYIANNPNSPGVLFAQPMDPMKLAKETLQRLGHTPSFSPGFVNKLATFYMSHVLSRKQAINLGGKTLNKMFKDHPPKSFN